ncbi:unnamed protein product [Acanthosepion pharaonis]|uniref:Uncharacterized protein n=1 Tax=Acanthosepion pharaonis TaxID=158019 RepID=A0A812AUG2_ACAPH|nr:unnamed protein product [Sepia pharaonis]
MEKKKKNTTRFFVFFHYLSCTDVRQRMVEKRGYSYWEHITKMCYLRGSPVCSEEEKQKCLKHKYVSLFTDFWLERRRSQDAIWSFLCIIFLMVLMLGIIWYYGLFNRKTKKYISVHEDTCHYTTVNKLIQAKAKLLPMFHKKKRKSKKIIEDSDVSVDTDYEDF